MTEQLETKEGISGGRINVRSKQSRSLSTTRNKKLLTLQSLFTNSVFSAYRLVAAETACLLTEILKAQADSGHC